MDASELRIGNLVNSILIGNISITGILNDKIFYSPFIKNPRFYEKFYSMYVYIEPIPLTEEWLKNFGFKNDYGKNWTRSIGKDYSEGQVIISYSFSREDKEAFQVSQGTGGDNCTWIYPPKPKYVHELQNLFVALSGKELTLKK